MATNNKTIIKDIKAIYELDRKNILTPNSVKAFIHEKVILLNESFTLKKKPLIEIIFSILAFILFFLCSCLIDVGGLTLMDISGKIMWIVGVLTIVNMILSLFIKDLKIVKILYYLTSFYLLLPIVNLLFPSMFINLKLDYNINILVLILTLILTIVSYVFVLIGLNRKSLGLKDIEYFIIEINKLHKEGIITSLDFHTLLDTLNSIKH